MINVILLGSNGALGSSVCKLLSQNSDINLLTVSRKKYLEKKNTIFWDYQSDVPREFLEADCIVNCARSSNFKLNTTFNQILVDSLPKSVKLINISSNSIYAKPNGIISNFFFKGDAYIREKKLIENYSKNKNNIVILRPTIVTDEGGWKSFLDLCASSNQIICPHNGNNSKIKIIKRRQVAEIIEKCIFNCTKVEDELYDSIIPVAELIDKDLFDQKNKNNYFNNILKNFLLSILSCWIMPDKLVFYLQKIMINNNATSQKSSIKKSDLVIEGMTRLYLFGKHTK